MLKIDFPILDNHLHLQSKGRNVGAIKDFEKAGGTHAILSHMPYDEMRITCGADFVVRQITLDMAERCNRESKVGVFVTLGPYPVLLIDLAKEHGLEAATQMMKEGMESAARLVREGKAIAIGEVGRPHFDVPPKRIAGSNDILRYGMSLAREAGCPIVIHAETATPETMGTWAGWRTRSDWNGARWSSTTPPRWYGRKRTEA